MADRVQTPTEPQQHEFQPLLPSTTFWSSLRDELKARFRPEQLPPLELESKPIPVKDIWSKDEKSLGSRLGSLGIHIGIILLLTLPLFHSAVRTELKTQAMNVVELTAPSLVSHHASAKKMGGGGGGGTRAIHIPSRGKLPPHTMKAIAPPEVKPLVEKPKLPVAPQILVPKSVVLPQVNLPQFGDPNVKVAPPSNGSGNSGGIGTGRDGGVGSGTGGGYGPGHEAGAGGGYYTAGAGISQPIPIFSPDPEYSDEARKAKFQGTVILWVVIGTDGLVHQVKVARPLGLGLDEKAIEAVKKWRFKPAEKDGHPVQVAADIEVNFRLY